MWLHCKDINSGIKKTDTWLLNIYCVTVDLEKSELYSYCTYTLHVHFQGHNYKLSYDVTPNNPVCVVLVGDCAELILVSVCKKKKMLLKVKYRCGHSEVSLSTVSTMYFGSISIKNAFCI